LVLNRPGGESFRRKGSECTTVLIEIDDAVISRQRAEGLNQYALDNDIFKSFGSNVPQPIDDLLSLSEINFQGQHDAPFWFSLTPGQVSKELNRIVNLDAMDRIMAKVQKWEREGKAVLSVGRDRLRAARVAKQELSWVSEAHTQLEGLEAEQIEVRADSNNRLLLRETIERASEANETRKALSAQGRGAKRGVWKLAGLKDAWDKVSQQARELRALNESIEGQARTVCQLRKELERAQEKLVEIRGTRCPLCGQ
jgi:hypothetical protein